MNQPNITVLFVDVLLLSLRLDVESTLFDGEGNGDVVIAEFDGF